MDAEQPADLLEVMTAIDACHGLTGPLSTKRRTLAWQAIDTADDISWLAARTILITSNLTLWQAVVADGTAPNHTPSPSQLLRAIQKATNVAPRRPKPPAG